MKALNPSEAPQRSVEIKIKVNFSFLSRIGTLRDKKQIIK